MLDTHDRENVGRSAGSRVEAFMNSWFPIIGFIAFFVFINTVFWGELISLFRDFTGR